MKIRKDKVEPYADVIILYVRDPKESTSKLL